MNCEQGTITVVNRKDLPPRAAHTVRIAIDRPHPLGNPFIIGPDGDREIVIEKYRSLLDGLFEDWAWFQPSPAAQEIERIVKAVKEGKDVQLVCNCKPKPCHGDIIKEAIERNLL